MSNYISTLPALDLKDGDTFFIDNSRYEYIMRCLRSAEYGIVHGRIAAAEKSALRFGECMHLAHKYRYKYYGTRPLDEAGQVRQFLIIEKFFENWEPPIGDYRTAGFAQYCIEQYNLNYQYEQFDILSTPSGVPVVEEGFTIPLGTVGKYKVVWKGRVDLAVRDVNDIWVVDHKHLSMGGEYATLEYFTSNQMKGYTFALRQILGQKVKGAMVNILVCRKQTKTGKGTEFMRPKFEYDDDILEEWQENTLQMVGDFFHSHDRQFFPMQTTQCNGRYGACQYRNTCTMSPATRLIDIQSELYKDDKFDPLHEDSVDLEAIHNAPVPANYQKISPVDVAQQEAVRLDDVLKGLNLL